jgi:hypothetical protein
MSYASDALIDAQEREIKKLKSENAKLRKFANLDTEDIDTMSCLVDDLKSENASLKGAVQGLGELCDRYKSENERLRACLGDNCADCAVGMGEYADSLCDPIKVENAKLRELIFDMLVDEERGHNDDDTYYEHVRLANGLGIEVRSRWSALTGTRGARTTATR